MKYIHPSWKATESENKVDGPVQQGYLD